MKLYKYPEEKDKMPEGSYYLYIEHSEKNDVFPGNDWMRGSAMYTGHIERWAEMAQKSGQKVTFCYGPMFNTDNLPDPKNLSTRLVSAFPGTGKSYFFREVADKAGLRVLDSDSSEFSWIVTTGTTGQQVKLRNPEFPTNYIKHIKDNMGKADIIFVSSHKEVRDALAKEGLEFFLVYPEKEYKEEYIKRYTERGNPKAFIDKVNENWDAWIDELEKFRARGCRHLVLWNEYLSDHTGLILS